MGDFHRLSSDTRKSIPAAFTCSVLAIAVATATPAFAQTAPAAAPQAAPQADDNTTLGDIVVTARKRSESIDTTPLSITAMTSAKIEERNLKSIDDVAAFSPGFYTQQQQGSGGRNDRSFRQLQFRGIGANSSNVGVGAGGVAFLDGAPVLNSSLSGVQDLERVEVLRGPQSAYFGRSTFIGAVNYITKDPTSTWTARLTGEYGEGNLVDLSGSISGPIVSDDVTFRISARHFAKDGQYYTSPVTFGPGPYTISPAFAPVTIPSNGDSDHSRRLGDQSTNSISATVLFKPTDSLKIRLFYNHFEDSDGPPAQYSIGGRGAGDLVPPVAGSGPNCNLGGTQGGYYCGTVPQVANPAFITANVTANTALLNVLVNNINNYPLPFNFAGMINDYGFRRHADQASGRIDYAFGDGGPTLTAISAYHEEKVLTVADIAIRALPYTYASAVGYKDYDFSQEVRLVSAQNHRFRWLIGGNYVYLRQSGSGIPTYLSNYTGLSFAPNGGLNSGQLGSGQYTQASTPSVFGGLYFDIVPKLTLTVEGRYQSDRISTNVATAAGVATAPATYAYVSKTFNTFSPRVSLDYKPTPTSTVYALFSRGYKPGGFNGSLLTLVPSELAQLASAGANQVYDQEKLDNYEVGIKGSFFNNRLRVALDGYIGRYTNAQIPAPVVYNRAAGGAPNTIAPIRNVGEVDLKGIEFEGEAIVLPGLRVGGTFAYTDTKITKYACQECAFILAQNATNNIVDTAAIGKHLPGAPEITYTLSANYEHKVGEDTTAYLGGDFLFRGKYYAEAANITNSGASRTFNGRIGLRFKKYSVELFARNLFDNQSPSIIYYPTDAGVSFFGITGNTIRLGLPDRRRIGVRVAANF